MAEYIEKEQTLEDIIKALGIKGEENLLYAEKVIYNVVKQAPAANVAEVVRCGECEYVEPSRRRKEEFPHFCTIHREHFKDVMEFCSFGKKRGEG